MNWVTMLLWALGIYLYLLLGTIIGAYSWRIYQRNRGNWDYPFSEIIFWPFSYLIKSDQTFIRENYWSKDGYILRSSIYWMLRLIWNAFWWIVIALSAILGVLGVYIIFRPLAYPFKKVITSITGPS